MISNGEVVGRRFRERVDGIGANGWHGGTDGEGADLAGRVRAELERHRGEVNAISARRLARRLGIGNSGLPLYNGTHNAHADDAPGPGRGYPARR